MSAQFSGLSFLSHRTRSLVNSIGQQAELYRAVITMSCANLNPLNVTANVHRVSEPDRWFCSCGSKIRLMSRLVGNRHAAVGSLLWDASLKGIRGQFSWYRLKMSLGRGPFRLNVKWRRLFFDHSVCLSSIYPQVYHENLLCCSYTISGSFQLEFPSLSVSPCHHARTLGWQMFPARLRLLTFVTKIAPKSFFKLAISRYFLFTILNFTTVVTTSGEWRKGEDWYESWSDWPQRHNVIQGFQRIALNERGAQGVAWVPPKPERLEDHETKYENTLGW